MLRKDDLLEWLPGCDAIIAGGEKITAEIMDASPRLRVIARTGVGYDAVDVPAATARKIPVTITPGANHESVAEQTFALILALVKDLRAHDHSIRAGEWIRTPLPRPLRGMTIGLVGLGRIGRAVAVRARAFGMRVIACDPLIPDEPDIEMVGFESLIQEADIVSLHLPITPETLGLFDRSVFASMKPGALLINTARGGLVVEPDLIKALESGQVGGAGLDVFGSEPPAPDNPLWSVPNLVLTPHMAGLDTLAMSEMARMAALCIADLHQGRWPVESVINPEVAPGWRW
jgi:phosphoglycerate dehydrogenase-like enzyme